MDKQIKIFWLVGENSGDLHASLVMNRLNQDFTNLYHYGVGGYRMQKEGLHPIFPFDRFAVMGFVEVIKHIAFFFKVEKAIERLFKKNKPDLAILVDYPGLNLRIANIADDAKIPILYFICPQFWAWKHKRVFQLKERVRHVACILPFEKELLDIHNVTSTYVGHPIAEEIEYQLDRLSFARFFGLDPNKKWIGFFPGSRNGELERMLPIYLQSTKELTNNDYQFLFSKARSVSHQLFLRTIETNEASNINVIDGYNYEMMKYCDFLVLTSGTVTLEAAFIGTPMVIAYKSSFLSYQIGKRLVRVDHIGLPNIILRQTVVPELIQNEVTPSRIASTVNSYMNNPERYRKVQEELLMIKALLGEKKASIQMVKIIKEMLKIYE